MTYQERDASSPPLVLHRNQERERKERERALWEKTPATAVLLEIVKSLRPHLIYDRSIASIIGERLCA